MTKFTYTKDAPLLLVGAGNMGGALMAGWLSAGLKASGLVVVDPALPDVAGATVVASADALKGITAATVIIAVKPQMMDVVLPSLKGVVNGDSLIISIAAGTPIARFEAELGEVPAVRAMPNTPAAIGKGITGLAANARCSDDNKAQAEMLLGAVGETLWVDSEALIDVVTATSGSGPAYVFYLVESLAAASVAAGMEEDAAMQLARSTIIGAAGLLEASDDSARELRRNVTSPNGTTAAALDVLMAEDGMARSLRRAVRAAKDRAGELAKG